MAIVFPRAMTAQGWAGGSFQLERLDVSGGTQGGRQISVQRGPPLWVGRWTTATLSLAEFRALSVWLDSLRGAGRDFLARDPNYAGPLVPLGAWDGAASSWSVNTPRDELTLGGLPAGRVVSVGDYVGFSWSSGTRRALVRAAEAATANGGGAATFAIEPALPSLTPGGATVSFAAPVCVARLRGQPDASAEFARFGRVSFEALQDLRP